MSYTCCQQDSHENMWNNQNINSHPSYSHLSKQDITAPFASNHFPLALFTMTGLVSEMSVWGWSWTGWHVCSLLLQLHSFLQLCTEVVLCWSKLLGMQDITISEGGFCVGWNSVIQLGLAKQNIQATEYAFLFGHSVLCLYSAHAATTPVLWDLAVSSASRRTCQEKGNLQKHWDDLVLPYYFPRERYQKHGKGKEGAKAPLRHPIVTSCNRSLRQAWESHIRNAIPALETCPLCSPPNIWHTMHGWALLTYLLRCTRRSKGFITAAEVRSWPYCWVIILEQPSGTYRPSLSGVAKEDGNSTQKELISRSILTRNSISGYCHYVTG